VDEGKEAAVEGSVVGAPDGGELVVAEEAVLAVGHLVVARSYHLGQDAREVFWF